MERTVLFKIFLFFIYTAATAFFLYFFIEGSEFYLTPYQLRPRLPGYTLWKPGGFYSHGLGVLGTVMMLVLFLYSARKRFKFLQRIGNLSYFLDFHIFLGIFGPLFVILHSTFKLNGIVSVSFWSMVAVALSGVWGRFLYLQIPRNKQGLELTRSEIESKQNEFLDRLSSDFNLDIESVNELKNLIAKSTQKKDLEKNIVQFSRENRLPRKEFLELHNLTKKYIKLKRQADLMDVFQKYFHYWHVFHKPFAYLMIIIMVLHVTVAILMGYKWIL